MTSILGPLAASLALIGLVALSLSAATASASTLEIEPTQWCPPQTSGCLDASEPYANVAEKDRWMAVKLLVTDPDGDPVPFVDVTVEYTEHDGDEFIERSKTHVTDDDGLVWFSLRNAADIHVEAKEALGEDPATGHASLEATWGTVHVDVDAPEEIPITSGLPIEISYSIQGIGPTVHPEGSISLSHTQDEHGLTVPVHQGHGDAVLAFGPTLTTGTHAYEVTEANLLGLPLETSPTLETHLLPGPTIRFEIDCQTDANPDPATQLMGGHTATCTATGLDALDNPTGQAPTTWETTAGALTDEHEDTATLIAPPHGGTLNITVALDEGAANTTRTFTATDEEPPTLSLEAPSVVATDTTTPLQATIADPGGLRNATLSLDGEPLQELDANGDAQATLEADLVLPTRGSYTLTLQAEDQAGNQRTLEHDVRTPTPVRTATTGTPTTNPTPSSASTATEDASTVTAQDLDHDGTHEAHIPAHHATTVRTADDRVTVRVDRASTNDLTVRIQEHRDDAIPDPIGETLNRVDVSLDDPNGQPATATATLTLTVDDDEIPTGATPATATILHWTGTYWERLETTHEPHDDTHRFHATTSSFSPFALTLPRTSTTEPLHVTAQNTPGAAEGTYRATFHADTHHQPVHVTTADHALRITFEAPHPSDYTIEIHHGDQLPDTLPEAPADVHRYLAIDLRDADDDPIDPGPVTARLDLGNEAAIDDIVFASSTDTTWAPALVSLVQEPDLVTATANVHTEHPYAMLIDTEDPRIGLHEALPAPLEEATTIEAVAADNVGIARVQLHIDGHSTALATHTPYTFQLDPADHEPGTYELTIQATDQAGNTAELVRELTIQPDDQLTPTEQEAPSQDGDPEVSPSAPASTFWMGALLAALILTGAGVLAHVYARAE